MSDPVWYQEGLRFKCTQCGNCCTGGPGAVWVSEEEIRDIAEHLGKPIGEIRLMHTRPLRGKTSLNEFPNGDCTFFNGYTRTCSIYPARPKQCRTWPFWDSNLADENAWNSLKSSCPGINQGDLVPLETIQQRAAEVHI